MNSMNERKIFCKDCKYVRTPSFILPGDLDYKCLAPENKELTENFEERRIELKNKPENINASNNCTWFKKKFWRKIFK
jgi:hypothetical protein